MAVTHMDLEIRRPSRELGSRAGTVVIVLCILCGLLGFVFSVVAEFSKTKASWVAVAIVGGKERFGCLYSGNGEAALLCGLGGFLTLAFAMIVQHAYMWTAVISDKQEVGSSMTIWDVDSSTGLLAKQAALLFLTSWVCFGVAEVLLVIGMVVESTHFQRWKAIRNHCLVVRHGSFLAAGFFDLSTVFLATAFYFVVLRMKRMREGDAAVGGEVAEAAHFSTPEPSISNTVSPPPNSAEEQEGGIERSPTTGDGILVKSSNSR